MTDDLSELVDAAGSGDATASDRIFTLLYEELRRCAHRQLDGANRTLSTTALVHETWLKLSGANHLRLESRQHFMALAARAMRQLLVDHARRVNADKRGGDALFVTLDERHVDGAGEASEVLALDHALKVLEDIDARACRVVQLHFFAGMTFAEIGALEGLNERTIKRDWEAARRLLGAEMSGSGNWLR
ncbi:MAG: RNA polymerase subunit sigma-70 [Xanthomonadales bacterium]|nr:RNA polymerase subunit sigma-70 [Xanthomonadales bacterium]